MLTVSDAWKTTYPGASAGVLLMTGLANPAEHPDLDREKASLEEALRAEFDGMDRGRIRTLPPFDAYNAYFSRFGKTYHVQLQVESIAFKGRTIPRVATLVEAMFMAELKNRLLTAGHDADALQGAVRLDAARGSESYTMMNGQQQTLKVGDMYMADAEGVISSVVYGPDGRTRITPNTSRALFAVYAPPGVSADSVRWHLEDISRTIRLVVPAAEVASLDVHTAQ